LSKRAKDNLQLGELFRFNYYFENDKENLIFNDETPNLVDVANNIENYWSEIIKTKLSPINQSKIAYILKLYNLKEKLKQLFSIYKNLCVGVYYLGLLNTEMCCKETKELIYFLDASSINNPEVSPFLYFEYIIEKIQFYLNCNQVDPIDSLLYKAEKIIKNLTGKYPKKIISYFNSTLMYIRGRVNKKMGKIIKAKDIFSQAITIFKKEDLEDHFLLANIFSEIASIELYFSLDNSEVLYRRSISIFETLKIEVKKNIEKANLAYVRFQKGYVDESLDVLIETMYYFEKKQITPNLLKIYLYLSEIFLILNHFENSEYYLMKSFELCSKYSVEVGQLYTIAFDYNLAIKNTEEANKYLNLFKNFNNKILNSKESIKYVFEYKIRMAQIELLKENIWDAEQLLLTEYAEISALMSSFCLLKRNSVLIDLYLLKFRVSDDKTTIIKNIVHLFNESNDILKRYFSLFQWISLTTQIAQFFIILDFEYKAKKIIYNIKESLAKFNISDFILLKIIKSIEVKLFSDYNKKTSQVIKLVNSYHYDESYLKLTEIDFFEIIETFTPLKENLLVLQIVDSTEDKIILSYNFSDDSLFLSNELLGGMTSLILKISREIQVEKANSNYNDCRFVFNSGFFATIFPIGKFSFSLITNFYTYDAKTRLINYAVDVYPILIKEGVIETVFKKIQEHF